MPSEYASAWPRVTPALGILGYVLAVLVALATSWFAVRSGLSAPHLRTLIPVLHVGVTSGVIMGTIAFLGIVAGAAGVVAHKPIFEHGAQAAGTDTAFSRLLGETIVRIFWWQHVGLWSCWLIGIVLGMLGAAIARVTTKNSATSGTGAVRPIHPVVCCALAMWFLVMTTLMVAVSSAVLFVMQERVETSGQTLGFSLSHPPSIIFDWPIVTDLALMTLAVWWNWRWPVRNWAHPNPRRRRTARLVVATTVGLSIGSILLCLVLSPDFFQRPLVLLGVFALLLVHVMGMISTQRNHLLSTKENLDADTNASEVHNTVPPTLRDWLGWVLPAWLLAAATWASLVASGTSISQGTLTWIATLTPNKPGTDRSLITAPTIEGTAQAILLNQWPLYLLALFGVLVFLPVLWFLFTWLPQRRAYRTVENEL
jgi:hypothetical protein